MAFWDEADSGEEQLLKKITSNNIIMQYFNRIIFICKIYLMNIINYFNSSK